MVLLFAEGVVGEFTIQHLVIFTSYRVTASCSEYSSIARLSEKNNPCYGSFDLGVEGHSN